MALLADPEFWARLFGMGVLNLLLSGDNALVIALAVRTLPRRERILGQLWGALGAVALRVVFVAVVSLLLRVPLLQLVGGLLLVWIAVELVRPEEQVGGAGTRHGASLREAIWIIIVADVTMSLDNVLAIAAFAKGDFVLIIVGLLMSLPIVVWGAGLLARLMNRYTWIVWLGGGVLGYVAGDMIVDDRFLNAWMSPHIAAIVHRVVPWTGGRVLTVSLVLGVAVTVLGWWLARRRPPHVPEDLEQ
ncbi:MAG: TerC family protein [Candidatus Rokubacteria bacterium]|nr:TerC family protein [Candidatus Rokubacteria bacterium]